MADAVTSQVSLNGAKNYVATFTNISDGTGETAVVKVDKSALTNELGLEPNSLAISKISWSVQGFSSVTILYDHTTDQVGFSCGAGVGTWDSLSEAPITDPAGAGGTGDILFTTRGAVLNATYSITLHLYKIGSV